MTAPAFAPFVLPVPQQEVLTRTTSDSRSAIVAAPAARRGLPMGSTVLLLREANNIIRRATADKQNWRLVGIASLDPSVRAFRGPKSDWLLLPAGLDPILRERGSIPMPASARKSLRAASRVHDFPVMYIAHEIPRGKLGSAGTFDGQQFTARPDATGGALLAGIPREVSPTPNAQRVARFADAVARTTGTVAGTLVRSAAATAAFAATAPLAVFGAISGLDPVLIGAAPLHGRLAPGTPAAYIEIARWYA